MSERQQPGHEAGSGTEEERGIAHADGASGGEAAAAGASIDGGTLPARGNKQKSVQKELLEWIKALAIAALLVFVIRTFLFAPFIVDGDSMLPNFETRERVIVNKLIYDIRAPKRGEVVVFYVPQEDRDFIKRVIAVPGDTIRYEGDDLFINGEQVDEPYIREAVERAKEAGTIFNTAGNFPNDIIKEGAVPEGMVFAMGDNRRNSRDSRAIGFIEYDNIIGRADLIFWPVDKIKLIKHG